METDSYPDAAGAAAALQDVQAGRRAAARRITTPWWYHPLVGAAIAVIVGSAAVDGPVRAVLLVGSIAALLALFWLYRRLTGLWINTLEVPGMRRPTLFAIGTYLAVLGLAHAADQLWQVEVALPVAGVLLGVAYTAYWRWVERQLVRQWQEAT